MFISFLSWLIIYCIFSAAIGGLVLTFDPRKSWACRIALGLLPFVGSVIVIVNIVFAILRPR